jgi:hypothetical protein
MQAISATKTTVAKTARLRTSLGGDGGIQFEPRLVELPGNREKYREFRTILGIK